VDADAQESPFLRVAHAIVKTWSWMPRVAGAARALFGVTLAGRVPVTHWGTVDNSNLAVFFQQHARRGERLSFNVSEDPRSVTNASFQLNLCPSIENFAPWSIVSSCYAYAVAKTWSLVYPVSHRTHTERPSEILVGYDLKMKCAS